LVIFNGIRFPFYLVDHVIAWSKNNNANLHALFIKAKHEVNEGYIFPSDLDAAEELSDNSDAEQGDEHVIQSQIKILEDMAKTKDIPFKSEVLIEPSLEDILAKAKGQNILFIDHDFNEEGILSVTRWKLGNLIKKSPCPVEAIKRL